MKEKLLEAKELISKYKSKSDVVINFMSLTYHSSFINLRLMLEDDKLMANEPTTNKLVPVVSLKVIPLLRPGKAKLIMTLSPVEENIKSSYVGVIETNEKRSPDKLHKAITISEDKKIQFKAMLKANFNMEEKYLTPIKITDYLEDYKYVNSLNGSLYNVMLFKYFEDNITKNTIFNTCYINVQSDTQRVIFGEESDIDKVRKWYTGRIEKAFKSNEGDIYLYLNMDLIDTEDDEVERVVYKLSPFDTKEEVA